MVSAINVGVGDGGVGGEVTNSDAECEDGDADISAVQRQATPQREYIQQHLILLDSKPPS
jgi:hypothetical protein